MTNSGIHYNYNLVLGTNGATLCDDKSTAACQRLAAVKPDMCQDNCTASLCPKTCGKCRMLMLT